MFFTTISKKRNLCLDNWKHQLGFESAPAALCKWAACTSQTFLSKTFANSLILICRNNSKKCLGKKVMTLLVIDKSTYHEKPHFDLFFYHTISPSKKMFFFQSASWKRHCVTHWREQRGMDSYLPRQISQSDCEISSNWGKN